MKMFKHVFFASVLMASLSVTAQETYQDSKLAAPQLTGTARYIGMGGAMEALGADISTISTNPAGVGLFRKSQVSLSAGVMAQGGAENYTEYEGTRVSFNGKKRHPTFDQIGIVWSPKIKGKGYINLAFNYHKSSDFGQILNAAASLNGASQNKLSALKYYKGVAGWTAVDANYAGYNNNAGKYVPGLLCVDDDRIGYVEANKYLFGQYQHGYVGTYDFNVSGSINNQVWLGLTVGIHDVHYNSNSIYSEDFVDGNYMESYEQLKITGSGFDVKAGVIFRPVKESPFRIGAYVNSPIFYDLKLAGDHDITISGKYMQNYTDASGKSQAYYEKGSRGQSADYDFRFNTPWKVGVSLGHTVDNFLAIGATYEYAWYNHMDNRVKEGGFYDYWGDYYDTSSSDRAMNADTRANLKGVSTLKVGLEAKPTSLFAIRLGYNYVSPMFKDASFRDQTLSSNAVDVATSSDYTNWKAINRFTAGLGFNYQGISVDLAYHYSVQKGDFHPFMNYTNSDESTYNNVAQSAKVKNNRHQIMMTLGYRF